MRSLRSCKWDCSKKDLNQFFTSFLQKNHQLLNKTSLSIPSLFKQTSQKFIPFINMSNIHTFQTTWIYISRVCLQKNTHTELNLLKVKKKGLRLIKKTCKGERNEWIFYYLLWFLAHALYINCLTLLLCYTIPMERIFSSFCNVHGVRP